MLHMQIYKALVVEQDIENKYDITSVRTAITKKIRNKC